MKKTAFAYLFLFFSSGLVHAQVPPPPPDSLFAGLYECISGPQGSTLDEARFRSFYHPDARLSPLKMNDDGSTTLRMFTVSEFAQRAHENRQKLGFWEKELSRRTEVWGNLAHAWSTYEGRVLIDGTETVIRGINSFQLVWNGQQWLVYSITWLPESTAQPLPKKYLKPLKTKKV